MSATDGYLEPNAQGITLRDYQHASKLFRDGSFRFLPKQEGLFHVAMNFGRQLGFGDSVSAERIQAGLLVKSVDLPSYTISNKINNAYNRKNIIQTQIEYADINVTFHDDSANLTNAMWQAYYEHYYADSYAEESEYTLETKYSDRPRLNWGYVPPLQPFFKSITIYSLAQQKFTGYTLINPLIKAWSHGKHTQGSDNELENKMQIVFETVLYSHGIIGEDEEPKFFTDSNYDNEISPLGNAPGSAPPVSVESAGATIRGTSSIFDSFANGDWEGGVAGVVDAALNGDIGAIGDTIVNTGRNIGGAILDGKDPGSVFNFPAVISGPIKDATTIAAPITAISNIKKDLFSGFGKTRNIATSNGSGVS